MCVRMNESKQTFTYTYMYSMQMHICAHVYTYVNSYVYMYMHTNSNTVHVVNVATRRIQLYANTVSIRLVHWDVLHHEHQVSRASPRAKWWVSVYVRQRRLERPPVSKEPQRHDMVLQHRTYE